MASAGRGDPLVGTTLDEYEIVELLWRGGASAIYTATSRRGGNPVALKVIFAEEVARRYARILPLLRDVSHQNLVPITAVGEVSGWLYLVSPYINGTTLDRFEFGQGSPDRALDELLPIIAQVADALDALHAAGVVHCDVKPDNVLVQRLAGSGVHAWLTDYGIAQPRGERLIGDRQFVGTPGYVAPEQIVGEPADPRADVFGLAVMTYELLAGHPPFTRDSEAATLFATVNEDPPAIPGLSLATQTALFGSLAKHPDTRATSASSFVAALRAQSDSVAAENFLARPAPPSIRPITVEAPPPWPAAEAPAPLGPASLDADVLPPAFTAPTADDAPDPVPEPRTARAAPDATDDTHRRGLPPRVVREESPITRGEEEDSVECSVFAPPVVARGDLCFVQVFAHLVEQADEVARLAQRYDFEADERAVRTLEVPVLCGSPLTFELRVPGLGLDSDLESLIWNGRPESVQFAVDVPHDFPRSTVVGTVIVSQSSRPLGHVKFKLAIGAATAAVEPGGEAAHAYRQAFISYASKDRAEVLRRLQLLAAGRIHYFQDLLDLDPGERYERELYRRIDECDLFLLFWSQAAKDSEWVRKEAECALRRQGEDGLEPPEIFPVILEGPPVPEPWPSLAALHFNDKLRYLIVATEGAADVASRRRFQLPWRR